MTKRGRKTSYSTFEKEINRIEKNFLKNIEYLQSKYARNFEINKSLQSSVYGTSKESFEFQLDIAKKKLSYYKKSKDVDYEKSLKDFTKAFSKASTTYHKTTYKRFTISSRDEYLNHFLPLGKDNDVIMFLKRVGLYDDPLFWNSYFESEYFTPIYKDYKEEDKSTWWDEMGAGASTGHSFWGDCILTYAIKYCQSNGIDLSRRKVPKFYEFEYYKSKD